MGRHIDAEERGFRLGVGVAVGMLVHGHDQPGMAKEILQVTGITVAKLLSVDAAEYDVSAARKAMRDG